MARHAVSQLAFAFPRKMGSAHPQGIGGFARNGMASRATLIGDFLRAKIFAQMLRVAIGALQRLQRSPNLLRLHFLHVVGTMGRDQKALVRMAFQASLIRHAPKGHMTGRTQIRCPRLLHRLPPKRLAIVGKGQATWHEGCFCPHQQPEKKQQVRKAIAANRERRSKGSEGMGVTSPQRL